MGDEDVLPASTDEMQWKSVPSLIPNAVPDAVGPDVSKDESSFALKNSEDSGTAELSSGENIETQLSKNIIENAAATLGHRSPPAQSSNTKAPIDVPTANATENHGDPIVYLAMAAQIDLDNENVDLNHIVNQIISNPPETPPKLNESANHVISADLTTNKEDVLVVIVGEDDPVSPKHSSPPNVIYSVPHNEKPDLLNQEIIISPSIHFSTSKDKFSIPPVMKYPISVDVPLPTTVDVHKDISLLSPQSKKLTLFNRCSVLPAMDSIHTNLPNFKVAATISVSMFDSVASMAGRNKKLPPLANPENQSTGSANVTIQVPKQIFSLMRMGNGRFLQTKSQVNTGLEIAFPSIKSTFRPTLVRASPSPPPPPPEKPAFNPRAIELVLPQAQTRKHGRIVKGSLFSRQHQGVNYSIPAVKKAVLAPIGGIIAHPVAYHQHPSHGMKTRGIFGI